MNSLLNILKRHPIAIVWHLLYIWYVIHLGQTSDMSLHGHDSGLPYVGFTFIIILIDILNAIFRKTDKGFYLCMGIYVTIQFIILN